MAADRVEPRNPVEETLARIWGELLATPTVVGVTDNLFALGGHSLTATRFVARVADSYGVNLPVHRIFAHPTIGELAEIVAADPDFGRADSAQESELDAVSDDELDQLLRAALAQRNRRRAVPDESGGSGEEREEVAARLGGRRADRRDLPERHKTSGAYGACP